MTMELFAHFLAAAAADYLESWYQFCEAEHSIDCGEFAPPPEDPPAVKAAERLIDDLDLLFTTDDETGAPLLRELDADEIVERDIWRGLAPPGLS